ncbi:hypothetical protein B7463_g6423, partial [Scytalidium lignicola]
MGFSTGLTGGVTLTLGIAYLTVLAHERNRQNQALALRAQSRVLQGLVNPAPLLPPPSRAELARQEQHSLIETAKEGWNKEIENAVRWIQTTDWNEVRDGMEASIARLLGSKERTTELQNMSMSKVQEALDKSKATVLQGKEQAIAGVKSVGASTKESLDNTGVVDTVRDVVKKGIEKGKEAIGKTQSAEGPGPAVSPSTTPYSDVEKALYERYEKPHSLDKSVEEVLEDRYKPIDSRDNSVLRGV